MEAHTPRISPIGVALALGLLAISGCNTSFQARPVQTEPREIHIPGLHLIHDIPAIERAVVNVVVEIPTGTAAKWEVEEDGVLRWQKRRGEPRVVKYLAYPGNYGMIPQSLSDPKEGGDGDPLDVLILGPAITRGEIASVRVIGALKMLDNGERDDKLLAVRTHGVFAQVTSLDTLASQFPGVLQIVETWFQNYKGPGEMVHEATIDATEANHLVEAAVAAYRRAHSE